MVEIVRTEMDNQGRSCKEHANNCGKVMAEDVVVRLHKGRIMVAGREEMAIAAIWVTDRIDCCRGGFLPCHMVKHVTHYDGALALAQVARVFSMDLTCCELADRHLLFKNRGF